MRHTLVVAVLSLATVTLADDKLAEKKAPWLIESTTNPVSGLPVVTPTGRHLVELKIELKITNNTNATQSLAVPRFWECHCDNERLGFGGWDKELRPAHPTGRPNNIMPINSITKVELGPGKSYTRSWNWVATHEESKTGDLTFRLGLVINGGKEPVWSSPIELKHEKPSNKTRTSSAVGSPLRVD